MVTICSADAQITKHKNNQKCDRPTNQRTNEQNLATIILDNDEKNISATRKMIPWEAVWEKVSW